MTTRRELLIALGAGALAIPFATHAQQPGKIPRIGYASASVATGANPDANLRAFRDQLKDLGYIEGTNIAIEYRFSQGKGATVETEQARELLRLNVDLLIATATPGIRAAKDASRTIPIVMVTTQDPVATGLIESLARPGGNLTGVTRLPRELSGKRLELLLEIVPKSSRVGFLMTTDALGGADAFKNYEATARALKVDRRSFVIDTANPNVKAAFDAALKARVNAINPIRNGAINSLSKSIAELAIKHRLPTMFEASGPVADGGLASYASDELESFRRAAVYVDKVLKGAKPANLPMEQPTKFEFVINLKTARQIGLKIPPHVLARADRVIE